MERGVHVSGVSPHELKPGEYTKYEREWHGCTPNGLLANFENHTVIINQDSTITVQPSILVRDGLKRWHGYLNDGAWIELDSESAES